MKPQTEPLWQDITKTPSAVPVAVAGHLLHDLAVDLVSQHLELGGRTEDLVGELQPTLHLLGGVVAHVLQDGWAAVKEKPPRVRQL